MALDLLKDTGFQLSNVDPQGETNPLCSHITHSELVHDCFTEIEMPGTDDEEEKRPADKMIVTMKKLNPTALQDTNVKLIQ